MRRFAGHGIDRRGSAGHLPRVFLGLVSTALVLFMTIPGLFLFYAGLVQKRKSRLGYDDSLDVFGVHGVGGFTGTLMAGVFSAAILGGTKAGLNIGAQVGTQTLAAVGAVVYTGIISLLILVLLKKTVGLRVTESEESEGLDLTQHEEMGYDL